MQDVIGYHERFGGPKVLYRDISAEPTFSIEREGQFNDTISYFVPDGDGFLLSVLNSRIFWFWIKAKTPIARGGFYRFKAQYIEQAPIPPSTDAQKAKLGALAEAAQAAAEQRYALQQDITRRIPDLAPSGPAKLTTKLKEWWNLPDFAAFQAEVKKSLKADIPLRERSDWDNWIAENRTQIHALTAEIVRLEDDINARVYALFDLTDDEIALLEANI